MSEKCQACESMKEGGTPAGRHTCKAPSSLAPAAGSPAGLEPPKPLVCRLADLIREFRDCAEIFKEEGNDDAYCSTIACAQRLHEVVTEFLTEATAWKARQPQENDKAQRPSESP